MKATLRLDTNMRLIGNNEAGQKTIFDVKEENGGNASAASPMEVLLQSVAACSTMDILSIIRKKRKTVSNFSIEMSANRAPEYPKVFVDAHFIYILESPDATEGDLTRAIELSQTTYCSAMAMLTRSGCTVTWEQHLLRP